MDKEPGESSDAHCHLYDDMESLISRLGFTVACNDLADPPLVGFCRGPQVVHGSAGEEESRLAARNGLRGVLQGVASDCTQWRLCIDNAAAWNKPRQSAILFSAERAARYPMPELERRLKAACDRLATIQGYDLSNRFETDTFLLENQR